jgi:hypothetical protein
MDVLYESRRIRCLALRDQTKTSHDDVLPRDDRVGPPSLGEGRKPAAAMWCRDGAGPKVTRAMALGVGQKITIPLAVFPRVARAFDRPKSAA